MQITQRYMTTQNAAVYCGMAKKTLENYRQSGTGPQYIKRKGLVRYRPQDLDKWMEEGLCVTMDQENP